MTGDFSFIFEVLIVFSITTENLTFKTWLTSEKNSSGIMVLQDQQELLCHFNSTFDVTEIYASREIIIKLIFQHQTIVPSLQNTLTK